MPRNHARCSKLLLPLFVTSCFRPDLHSVLKKTCSNCDFSDLLKYVTLLAILVLFTKVKFSAFTLEGTGNVRRPVNDMEAMRDSEIIVYVMRHQDV